MFIEFIKFRGETLNVEPPLAAWYMVLAPLAARYMVLAPLAAWHMVLAPSSSMVHGPSHSTVLNPSKAFLNLVILSFQTINFVK